MSSKLPVSIIGAGNTGCTFAADLASRGVDVLLYGHPKHRGNIDAIRKKGCLASSMEIEGEFNPILTTEMADAVRFSHFLVVTVPSYGHADIINNLKGFDLSNHIIVVINGNFFALLGHSELNAQAILETNASPYASWVKDGEVSIAGVKSSLPIAALPNNMGEQQGSQISEIFPKTLLWCNNIFEIGMQSNNGVIHPAAGILNTGWIESRKGDFLFYRDGISPSVGNVIEAVDAERLKIAEAFGFRLQTVLQEMVGFYGGACEKFSDFASQTKVHNAKKIAPTHMQDRYVSEDVPYILVPWYELGSRVEVQAPTIKAVVDIASVINGVDYFKSGRNLKRLGMDHMSKIELLRFIDSATWHLPWAM